MSPRSDSMFPSRRVFQAPSANATPILVPSGNPHSGIEHHIMELTKQIQR